MREIYLDYAASTPLDPELVNGLCWDYWANPSSRYSMGRKSKAILENSRITVAQILGCDSSEIYFCPSATIANNLAISGYMKNLGGNIIISDLEHPSVLQQQQNNGFETKIVNSKNGLVDVEEVLDLIDDKTRLISLMYVNNILGTIQPVVELSNRLKEINRQRVGQGLPKIVLHSDCAQAFNYLDFDISSLGVDILTLSSSKIYAPRGCAVLYVKNSLEIAPIVYGGGQENGIISGSENVDMIDITAKAMQKTQTARAAEVVKLNKLNKILIDGVMQIPNSIVLGVDDKALNIISFGFKSVNQDELLTALYLEGLFVGAGSSCSSGSGKVSEFIKNLGYGSKFNSYIRVSIGRFTTTEEIEIFTNKLAKIIHSLS